MIRPVELRSLLLDLIPAAVVNMLLGVERRLKSDWEVTHGTLVGHVSMFNYKRGSDFVTQKRYPDLLPPGDTQKIQNVNLELPPEDFMWAWLNGNDNFNPPVFSAYRATRAHF